MIGEILRIANNILVKDFNTRPFTMYVKNNSNEIKLRVVEVGVAKGYNAKNMLQILNIEKLYLVDEYKRYLDYNGYTDFSKYEKEMRERLRKYSDKIKLIKEDSFVASKMFKGEFFDYGYIDATHTLKGCYRDLVSWFPKIKIGGALGGHDFDASMGVPKAVQKFCSRNNLDYSGYGCDWWIKK